MTLYLVDGALFFLHLWLKNRKAMPPASHVTQVPQNSQDDRSVFAETLG